MMRWFHWKWCVLMLVVLVGLAAAGVAVLSNRGDAVWTAYAESARARGVKLSVDDFRTPAPSAEQNFVAGLVELQRTGVFDRLHVSNAGRPKSGPVFMDQPFDWPGWRKAFLEAQRDPGSRDDEDSDEAVVRALELHVEDRAALSSIETRPRAWFDIQWEKGVGADFSVPFTCLGLGQWHATRALAALHVKPELSLAELRGLIRVIRALETAPALISGLVHDALCNTTATAVWRGLGRDAWTADERAELRTLLAPLDCLASWRFAAETERAMQNEFSAAFLRREAKPVDMMSDEKYFGALAPFVPIVAPGWVRASDTRNNRFFDEQISRVTVRGWAEEPADGVSSERLSGWRRWLFGFDDESRSSLRLSQRAAMLAEAALRMARTALDLEGFRARTGFFPETLQELGSSASLDRLDPINAQPLRYRRVDPAGYLLYSIGPNRRDDGGSREAQNVTDQPDWVWRFPPP